MKASKNDIRAGLKALERLALSSFQKGDTEKALHYIDAYSSIASQFNLNYFSNAMESLLAAISREFIKTVPDYKGDPDKWVLYDDFCTTYVLGVQWLEAMASSGKEILYITTRDTAKENRHKNILDRVAAFPNVKTIVIPQGKSSWRAQLVYDAITGFNASKVVLHKYPAHSISNLVLPSLPEAVKRYVINLSDQTFWLGAKSIDYCLEFRPFGASVSLQRRGLKRDQLLMVPFYPTDDRNEFAGFPTECTDDKVIIFSGGDYYKTLDENRTYWTLVKEILDKYPQVVFLFATKNIPEGDSEIKRFITDNHFEGRFIYIQFRPDIYQVFAHCDIYMGTCPASGSLMSQLAAINGKPILQYYAPSTPDDETEQAICINQSFQISFNDRESFMQEADRLIKDPDYRARSGKRLKEAMMQPQQFNKVVSSTLTDDKSQFPIVDYPIDYSSLDDRWYYLEKAGYTSTLPYLYSLIGWRRCPLAAPSIFIKKNFARFFSRS
jgi:hypothetical protein